MKKLRVLDLFSGIGGFSLGLERAGGFETVAFCEIEEYPRKVLEKHWPGVPIYEDVRTLTASTLARDGIAVDVICGGFPCQDISFAGRRAGLEGARSGLWSEYARLIGELRPRFVIVENVPGLLSLGMGTVLGDLAALGYSATWDCIPACAVGAPHRRDRVWIVAHALRGRYRAAKTVNQSTLDEKRNIETQGQRRASVSGQIGADGSLADANSQDEHGRRCHVQMGRKRCEGQAQADDDAGRIEREPEPGLGGMADGLSNWAHEPDGLSRVAKGVKNRLARLKGLGNAVVPQIPELIGRAIMQAEGMTAIREAAE